MEKRRGRAGYWEVLVRMEDNGVTKEGVNRLGGKRASTGSRLAIRKRGGVRKAGGAEGG